VTVVLLKGELDVDPPPARIEDRAGKRLRVALLDGDAEL
jgi:hypothetical protein